MELEICTIGGFDEVGRNMVAVRCGNEAVIIDMGILLSSVTELQQQGVDFRLLPIEDLIEHHVVADDSVISGWNVIAIIVGHCHLDHIAGVPFLAAKYNVPIYGTAFTLQVLQSILADDKIKLPNEFIVTELNRIIPLSKNFKLELINTPHSTLQCAITTLHTPKGIVMYTNDFKMDDNPIINSPPNYKRFKQLAHEGIRVLICDSLYAPSDEHTESESVARDKLEDVLLDGTHQGNAVFVTCFSSHLERIKSISVIARKMDRQVVTMGRSMARYITSAHEVGAIDFYDKLDVCSYSREVNKALQKISKDPGKYLVICTGGQGEPGSILDRLLREDSGLSYQFREGDAIVFSCRTIPVEPNLSNRAALEKRLAKRRVRVHLDVHVSGHAAAKDLRNFIKLVEPKHVIPAHGIRRMTEAMHTLCEEMGVTAHVMRNGEKIIVDD